MIYKNLEEYILDGHNKYSIDKNELFIYGFIFMIIISFISKFNITLSVILGIIIAYYITNHLYQSSQNHDNKQKSLTEKKADNVRPNVEEIKKYTDVTNFLFTIQDFYVYNPPAYEEMVKSIKNFFLIYEESNKIPDTAHKNYSVAELQYNNAVNCLHSIILNANTNRNGDDKISRSVEVLHKILYKYLEEIELIIKKDIKYNGYNTKTKALGEKYKPYNYSEFSKYTFDVI